MREVTSTDPRPIGVFDSGVGGLTVARALMDLLPEERIVYFGDTARGPYGPRQPEQVRRFTAEIVDWLAGEDTKLVVAACNSATAAALDPALPPPAFAVPVVGVIAPAVEQALAATRAGRVGVIGTRLTIESGAYEHAIGAAAPDVVVVSRACPRFVELTELGRTSDQEVLEVARDYLAPLQREAVDTVILGCTHYPLLTGVISYVLGPEVTLISSAEATARAVFGLLVDEGLLAHRHGDDEPPAHRFVASGDAASFARLAARFLGPRLAEPDVETIEAGRPLPAGTGGGAR